MLNKKFTRIFVGIVVGLGLCSLIFISFKANLAKLNFLFIALSIFAVILRSKPSVNLPQLKSHLIVTNSIVFLAFLLYGGAAAIIIATAEAFISSLRFSKNKITIWFNTGLAAFSTFLPSLTVKQFIYPNIIDEIHSGHYSNLFIALAIISSMHFILSSTLHSLFQILNEGTSFGETWKSNTQWSIITYTVGAVIAGLLAVLVDEMGFQVLFTAIPIVFFVYRANRMYLKNVEITMSQAEQSKKYALALETQAKALRESEERFRTAFDFAPIGIALMSPDGKWQKVNHSLCKILGYSESELLNNDFKNIIHPDDLNETFDLINSISSDSIQSFQKEQRLINKQNKVVWVSWSGASVSYNESNSASLIFQIQNISDKKIVEEKLQHEANHDALTGLPNRGFFMSRLELSLANFKRNPNLNGISVLFIDLDRFKVVNDNLGHFAGDKLLVEIAQRLRKCLRPNDILARLAGDEFTILVEGNHEIENVVAIAKRIEEQFTVPFMLNGTEVYSSASIGILKGREYHNNAEEILRDADVAMYQAKTSGRGRYEIFDSRIHSEIKETFKFEKELRNAISREELSVYYQPIYSIESEQIEGFEALARWKHKTLGFIPPDKFIKIAEESGLINLVGEQILRRACSDGVKLLELSEDSQKLFVSVNLSCKQFAQPKLVQTIENILIETGFPPHNLKLEITESVFFEYSENAAKMLERLCQLGIKISIDDFGTGYSNLNYLSQMPISTLKIDRSFISPLVNKKQHLTIVQTILTLAQGLGIKVIAEGVENEQQLNQLKLLNCEGAQGYLFAKPMTFNETQEFLQKPNSKVPEISNFSGIAQIATIQ